MKTRYVIGAIAALSLQLVTSGMAQAQNRQGPDRNEGRSEQQARPGPDGRGDRRVERRDDRRDDRRVDGRGDRPDARYEHDRFGDTQRGAGPDYRFHRGNRLPPEYRNRQYVVNDWRGHHLSAPPRGHQWVQVGADYVLVAVATGIIANILLNQ